MKLSTRLIPFAAALSLMTLLSSVPPVQALAGSAAAPTGFLKWAPRPPMGWNSWDCYGAAVNEQQTRANAQYMHDKLAQHGWQYIVVDIQWYEPRASGFDYRKNAQLAMDGYGRLLPAVNRFPSADGGAGFRSLAEYVHSLGLKFGIHLLRGIPRQAVAQNTPVLGTSYHAADIADQVNVCPWNGDMYGVDMTKPGAQAYYDSVFRQIASWDVDFVKVDDLTGHDAEIAAIRAAIDRSGRPMVLSVSPGPTALASARFIADHANMWRISDDFWDNWASLKEQMQRCADWAVVTAPGHYPDADMLPFGAVRVQSHDWTHFTHDEQVTVMTMWSMFRSPLMMGGNLPENDDFTLALLTNDEVLAVDQTSANGRQLFRSGDEIGWIADSPGSPDKYLALFNAADRPAGSASNAAPISVDLRLAGFSGPCRIEDLWAHRTLGEYSGAFAPAINYHGAGLYRVTPVAASGNP